MAGEWRVARSRSLIRTYDAPTPMGRTCSGANGIKASHRSFWGFWVGNCFVSRAWSWSLASALPFTLSSRLKWYLRSTETSNRSRAASKTQAGSYLAAENQQQIVSRK